MINYLIRYEKKEEIEYLYFRSLEEAIIKYNNCTRKYGGISVVLTDIYSKEVIKLAYLYRGSRYILSLYDNVILADRIDYIVYTVVNIDVSNGRVTLQDLNVNTRSVTLTVPLSKVIPTRRDYRDNYRLVTHIKRKYPYSTE